MPVLGIIHGTKIGPDSPTITSVTDVGVNREFDNGAVDVAFTLPGVNTAISYTVTSSNGRVATGNSSPIRVQNLPTGIDTTFTITGTNNITIEGPISTVSTGVIVTTVPYRPTMGSATAGNGQAFIVFSLLNSGGKQVISYVATGSPSGSGSDSGSPVTVSGLNNDVPHAFTVVAVNANGGSLPSSPSNVVTPSTSGGGVPAGTFYCYSSDCFSQDGVNFAYLQAPIFTSVSPTDQTTLTNYSGGFGFARGTRVTYCNTVEATAAIGAQQSVCQAVYVPPLPPAPCPSTTYTGECGAYTAGPQVPGCGPNASYGYTVTQTAPRTSTIYDCNGVIVSITSIPCTQSTFTATTSNDPRCPGYSAPVSTYRPITSVNTGAVAPPAPGDPVITPDGYGGFSSSVTNTDGSTTISFLDSNQQPTADAPITMPNFNMNFSFSDADWSGLGGGFNINIDYDALQALIDSFAQPTTTEPVVDTTTSLPLGDGYGYGGFCFLFGTKITMADGSFKNIEDLNIGDELLTFDIPGLPSTDNPEDWSPESTWSTDSTSNFTKTTTKVSYKETGTWWRHHVINGQYRVTREHWIFVKRDNIYQFVQVAYLKVGDAFLTANKTEIEITNIELIQVTASTVSLDVEDNDMYFADGILAHNLRAPVSQIK